ncbi:MAG: NAD(P)-dependent oxidoreductase [Actinobacteria bacterium]|nr:NAD(P)-dependent oxidoreductase [Actinomycetota bacterium]
MALFGAGGFVGKSLFSALSKTGKYHVVPITRENYSSSIGKFYNIIINSAMPAARFWAKNNPAKDFQESVQKTANILYGCTFDKFVQISTVSARCQLDTVYGRHKLATEDLCNYGNNLIIRLSSMFGSGLKKGVLIDMLKGQKVFIDGESRYSFASVDFVGNYIASHLDLRGIVEVGSFNTVRMIDIANYLHKAIEFEGPLEVQEIQNPDKEFPDAKELFKFLDTFKEQL